MANGIDSILNATENAFAGDQQGLQQRYAMTQELTDLMTLQKMKSDYEAADREMKMAMGEQPTIAQQRPQEVMQLAQNQVAQRVGGVAQKQQQDMQKQQQRMMQAAARPQPPMGGVPGLMQPPPQAAPPMGRAGGGMIRGYRGGGIVPHYAEGGSIPMFDEMGRTGANIPDNPRSVSTRNPMGPFPPGSKEFEDELADMERLRRERGKRTPLEVITDAKYNSIGDERRRRDSRRHFEKSNPGFNDKLDAMKRAKKRSGYQSGGIVALRQGGEMPPPGTQKPGAKINSLPTLGAVPATENQGGDEQIKRDAQRYLQLERSIADPNQAQYKIRNQRFLQELIDQMGNNHAKVMQYVDSLKGMAHSKSELDASLKGMSGGGIVALQEGGSTGGPPIIRSETPEPLNQGMSDEEITVPEDSLPKEFVDWVKDNPADAASLGLMAIPIGGAVGGGLLRIGKWALPKITQKLGPAIGRNVSKLFTRPLPSYRNPQTGRMMSREAARQAGVPAQRAFSIPRTAGTLGVGIQAGAGLASLLGGDGGEEQPAPPSVAGSDAYMPDMQPQPAPQSTQTPEQVAQNPYLQDAMANAFPAPPPQAPTAAPPPPTGPTTPADWMRSMIAQHGTPTPPEPTRTERLMQQYEDIYAQQNDPKELAYQRLWGSMGDGLNNTAERNLAIRNAQEARALGGVKDLLTMSQAADINKAQLDAAQTRAETSAAASRYVANSQAAANIRAAIINTTARSSDVQNQIAASMDELEARLASEEANARANLTQDAAEAQAATVFGNLQVQTQLMEIHEQVTKGNLTPLQAEDATNEVIDRAIQQYRRSLGQDSGQTNSPAFNQVR